MKGGGGSCVLLRYFGKECWNLSRITPWLPKRVLHIVWALYYGNICSSWGDPEPSPLSSTFTVTMVTSNGILILDPAMKFHMFCYKQWSVNNSCHPKSLRRLPECRVSWAKILIHQVKLWPLLMWGTMSSYSARWISNTLMISFIYEWTFRGHDTRDQL